MINQAYVANLRELLDNAKKNADVAQHRADLIRNGKFEDEQMGGLAIGEISDNTCNISDIITVILFFIIAAFILYWIWNNQQYAK